MVWLSATGVGLANLAYSWAPTFWMTLVCAMFAGFCFMRQLPGTNTLVQSVIHDEYRGRVMALYAMSVTGMLPLGNLAAGFGAQWIGPRATIAVAGVMLLAAALRFGRRYHEVEAALV